MTTPSPTAPSPGPLRRRSARWAALLLAGLVGLLLVYALLLTLLIPRALAAAVERLDERLVAYDLEVVRIAVNPFTLRISLHEVSAQAVHGVERFHAPHVHLDPGPATLARRGLVLRRLVIEEPSGVIEWSGALEHGPALGLGPRVAALLGWLARLHVGELELDDGSFEVQGSSGGTPDWNIGGLAVRASGIAPDVSPRYAARVAQLRVGQLTGVTLSLEGRLSADADTAEGWAVVDGVNLAQLPADSLAGFLHATTAYRWSATHGVSTMELEGGLATLRRLELTPSDGLRAGMPNAQADFSARRHAGAWMVHAALTAPEMLLAGLAEQPLRFTSVAGSLHAEADGNERAARGPWVELGLDGLLAEDGGRGSIGVHFDAMHMHTPTAFALRLEAMPAEPLADYMQQLVGHRMTDGRIDLALDLRRRDSWLEGELQFAALGLSWSAGEAGAIELVTALLEDPRGQLQLALPLRHRVGPDEDLSAVVAQALRRQLAMMVEAPFAVLDQLAGYRALGRVQFEPGSATPRQESLESLEVLSATLQQRPRLGIVVPAAVDLAADRRALAERQVELHVSLDTADPARLRPGAVDFTSPRAQDILDEFAGERLDPATLARIRARSDVVEEADPADRAPYYRALFEALVQAEQISELALARLARFRAQSVAETLTAHGLGRERIDLRGEPVDVGTRRPVALVTVELEVRALAHDAPVHDGAASVFGAMAVGETLRYGPMNLPAPDPLEWTLSEAPQPQRAQQQLRQEQRSGEGQRPCQGAACEQATGEALEHHDADR